MEAYNRREEDGVAALQADQASVDFSDLMILSVIERDESPDKVYKVMDRMTAKTYALKVFNRHYDFTERNEICGEIEALKKLDHPNLVKCFGVYYDRDSAFLLLENLDSGSPISPDLDIASYGHQLLLGLRHLHRNKIYHGDIVPSNIFVNHLEQVKVLYSGKTLSKTLAIPPEIGAIHDGFSWDVWNLGLCIMKLFKGLNWCYRDVEFCKVTGSEGALTKKPSTELLSFVLCCMQTDLAKRWTADDLVHHPFIEQLSLKKKRESSPETRTTLLKESFEGMLLSASSSEGTPFQRCIDHCKLFIPDCEFVKDKLVRMWIAEERIELEGTKRMEDVGNLYFDVLVHNEVFIPSKFDPLYKQMKYIVNTSKVSNGSRNYASNLDEICEEALHLTWHCESIDQSLCNALKKLKQLRTLVVVGDRYALIKPFPNIFSDVHLLKTLDLSGTHISELPDSVGKLESLRFIDVSGTPIKCLPETTARLSLLQTLNLKGCFALYALPRGLGRLINLRHLDLDCVMQLKSMPRGMGNLINLQTLPGFLVGKNDGCGIGELKKMNEITGSFCIYHLENVSSAEEAKEAALRDKEHIDELHLRWGNHANANIQDTKEILESLQPHFHLKKLELTFYGGSKLPTWISNPSFIDLASIMLYKCINCDVLPYIGELPSLKILYIVGMNNVKNIDSLLFRNPGTHVFNAFPRLEKLTLDEMLHLEEWTGIEDGDFPCLRHLSIKCCPKLYVIPSLSHLSSLQELKLIKCMQLISLPEGLLPASLESIYIDGCPKIKERCRKDEGVDWFKIASVKNVWIDFERNLFE